MIKVNLLRDQTAPTHTTFAKPTVSRTGLMLLAVFMLAAGGMGTFYFYVRQQVTTTREKQRVLRREEERLQELKKEIDKFEKLKQQRLNRIEVIERLKENQKGPVILLNHIIQSMPRDGLLWLTSLTQKDDRIKIVGYTQHTEVIPDFMSNLAAGGSFQTVDLELIESQKEASKFALLCTSFRKQEAE
jgi:Tfp pilus assembly protein PilN